MRRYIKTPRLLAAVLATVAMMTSCAHPQDFIAERTVFQSIEIGNDGHQVVRGASVLYGDMQLITGPARQKFPVANPIMYRYSIGFDGRVPAQTILHWVTEDNITHDAAIPTRGLVSDFTTYYGFRFYFVDDHVDIYLIEKKPNPGNYLNLKYTKVYPPS